MVRMFTWGSRCPGKEGGSLRECTHLGIEMWCTHDGGYFVSRVRGFTFLRMKSMVDSSGVPGPKMAETPFSFNLG